MHISIFTKKKIKIWALVSDGKQALVFNYHRPDFSVSGKNHVSLNDGTGNCGNCGKCGGNCKERSEADNKDTNQDDINDSNYINKKENFITEIAKTLKDAYNRGEFDYFVLAVPFSMARALNFSLESHVRARLLTDMPNSFAYDGKGPVLLLKKNTTKAQQLSLFTSSKITGKDIRKVHLAKEGNENKPSYAYQKNAG